MPLGLSLPGLPLLHLVLLRSLRGEGLCRDLTLALHCHFSQASGPSPWPDRCRPLGGTEPGVKLYVSVGQPACIRHCTKRFPSPVSGNSHSSVKRQGDRTSLVAQWLRIRLPMQATRVRALVREDPTCRGATRPVRHTEPVL